MIDKLYYNYYNLIMVPVLIFCLTADLLPTYIWSYLANSAN